MNRNRNRNRNTRKLPQSNRWFHTFWMGRGLGRRISILVPAALLCLGGSACTEQKTESELQAGKLAEARKLESLPYVISPKVREENRGLRGVVHHDSQRAHQGLNLYGSLTRPLANLRTMSGELVHTWNAEGVFTSRQDFPLGPGSLEVLESIQPGLLVAEVHGDHLFAIETFSGIVKLDWDSRVIFSLPNNAHHDLDVAGDGSLFVLTAAPRLVETGAGGIIIIDDVIERLAPDGSLLQTFSVFEILAENEETRPRLAENIQVARHWFNNMDQWVEDKIQSKPGARASFEAIYMLYQEAFVRQTRTLNRTDQLYVLLLTPADILHSNTLEVLSGRDDALWSEGDVLVSVRNLDLVVVLDLDSRRVVWSWGPGELSRQHQPSTLANGNLLIFDNGIAANRSRVIELNPATRQIVWSFGDDEETRFFCSAMGGAMGLPNGNVLITDSSTGRSFEIDRKGRVVWDFFNPDQGYNPFGRNTEEEVIESIYRVERVEPLKNMGTQAK